MPFTPGTVVGHDFRILRPLAEGGMGAVYEAEQLSTGRRRALKTMHAALASSAATRERFAQEARIGSAIPSDHIVEVIAAGIDEATGTPWLVMELLEGETLGRHLARTGAMSPAEALAVMDQLCHALDAAHRQAIVHRDLKPDNVFLARSRRSDVPFTVKVLDFGIAKWMQESQSTSANSQAMGTPLWMAPEQATPGMPIRPATDVWALGLIAFSMLTGKAYWKSASMPGGSVQSLVVEIMVEPLEPPSSRCRLLAPHAQLPIGFDDWFARCVNREPHLRFADAGAANASLRAMLQATGPGGTQLAASPLTPSAFPSSASPGAGAPGGGTSVPFVASGAPSAPARRSGNSRLLLALILGAVLLGGTAAAAIGGYVFYRSRRASRDPGGTERVDRGERKRSDRSPSPRGDDRAVHVAAGPMHACARMLDKTLRCWGNNMLGQLGDGTTTERPAPVPVPDLEGVDQVAAGSSYTCAVLGGGTVRCWGDNQTGQLGDGTTQPRRTPTPALDLTGATSVTAGFWHSCAVVSDRTVRCWGGNAFGGLGEPGLMQRATPAPVPGLRNVSQVRVGIAVSCALHVDGSVSCWGAREREPRAVAALADAQQIAVGARSACALMRGGTIRCFGDNKDGQLGDGTTSTRSGPVRVVGIDDAVQVSLGASHGCAVRRGGSVACWGANSAGQLGDGTMREQLAPVEVRGLSSAREVAVGGNFSCARDEGGAVYCWGGNENGQLGDGTHTARGEPAPVHFAAD